MQGDNVIQERFESWAILEIFGHVRMAGKVSEATIGGCSFVRIDVPDAGAQKGFTRYYGQGAIYSMTPCTEEIARSAAASFQAQAVSVYDLDKETLKRLTAPKVPYEHRGYPSDYPDDEEMLEDDDGEHESQAPAQ